MFMLLLLRELDCDCDWEGGWGRAKGLGGPEAPAERRADADGEGGGRTTPEEWEPSVPLRWEGWLPVASVDSCGEESAVALPPSEGSSGIWTLRTGLLVPI
jgi:hypothetical protein